MIAAPRRLDVWGLSRLLFVSAALWVWLPRRACIIDDYSSAGVVLPNGPMHLTQYVIWSPSTALFLWGAILAGLIFVAINRMRRAGLLVFAASAVALCAVERVNMYGYDRLLIWQALILSLDSGKPDGRTFARSLLLILYAGVYGSSGWIKLLAEPQWWKGIPLAYSLVDSHYGGFPIGVWLSAKPVLMCGLAIFTLSFEVSFPFLVWMRKTNPWILAGGVLFHVGICLTMNLFVFSLAAVSMYPILLDREAFSLWKNRFLQRRMRQTT